MCKVSRAGLLAHFSLCHRCDEKAERVLVCGSGSSSPEAYLMK